MTVGLCFSPPLTVVCVFSSLQPPHSLSIPFTAWMKWPHVEGEQGPDCVAPVGPGRVLLRELLWQLEQREQQVLEEELQHRLSRSSSMGYRRPMGRPSLLALMPASECRQLECLCARIPPSHTATVLSRFRDILAHNDVLPWELVCIFKQVLRDFLRRQDEAGTQQSRKASPASPSPEGQERHREEIPTISSYVDRHLRSACPYAVQRDCLPYYRTLPDDCPEAYSTTL
uniref:Protein RD3-like n=1 Tax=Astyanax mexicanus TaxID=7994 RepID=A0A8B9LRT3_ASTMX